MAVLQFKVINAGDQGRDLIEKLKYNFDLLTSFADTHTAELIRRIVSDDIDAIKLENGVMYYTKDLEVAEPVWVDMSPTWGKIVGDITKQTDLKKLLDSKVDTVTFTLLANRVEAVENSNELMLVEIGDLKTRADETANTITSIFDRLTVAENALLKRIVSNQILEMRQVSKDAPIQYTTDGINWVNITGSQFATAWGNIGGDIENQLDLKTKFENINEKITTITEDLTDVSNLIETISTTLTNVGNDLVSHTGNLENPHQVSKEQLGLDKVDNTSDANKPLSTAQKEYIDEKVVEVSGVITTHKDNKENPHQVTKKQLGLENVDNTRDIDKPVSNAQKTYIENVVGGMVESKMEENQRLWVGTLAEYQVLVQNGETDENCLYITK